MSNKIKILSDKAISDKKYLSELLNNLQSKDDKVRFPSFEIINKIADSTFAAIKKKFGETIKSKNRIAQENESLCKIIAYNITVPIHSM